jgi:hypothetical protein
MKKFFKDYRQARIDISTRLRRLEKAEREANGELASGGLASGGRKPRNSKRAVLGPAKEEKIWAAAVKEGRRAGSRGGLMLRSRR